MQNGFNVADWLGCVVHSSLLTSLRARALITALRNIDICFFSFSGARWPSLCLGAGLMSYSAPELGHRAAEWNQDPNRRRTGHGETNEVLTGAAAVWLCTHTHTLKHTCACPPASLHTQARAQRPKLKRDLNPEPLTRGG